MNSSGLKMSVMGAVALGIVLGCVLLTGGAQADGSQPCKFIKLKQGGTVESCQGCCGGAGLEMATSNDACRCKKPSKEACWCGQVVHGRCPCQLGKAAAGGCNCERDSHGNCPCASHCPCNKAANGECPCKAANQHQHQHQHGPCEECKNKGLDCKCGHSH